MTYDPIQLNAAFQREALAKGFSSIPISQELVMPAFSRAGEGPTVLLSAGIHGDEPASFLAALEFLRRAPSHHFHWLITPMLNPTGIALGKRESAAGHDLNRDYHLGSTPEVAAHLHWLARQPVPDIFISLHEDYDGIGFYFYEIQLNGQPSIAPPLLESIARSLPIEPGPIIDGGEATGPGHFFRDALPPDDAVPDGLPEAILLSQLGCPLSLTFETPTFAASLEHRIEGHLAGIEVALTHFREI